MTEQRYPFPNLFKLEPPDVASSLYHLGAPVLLWRGGRIEALRQLRLIRRFGRQEKVARRYYEWTRSFELNALIGLGRNEAAWRLVRAQIRQYWPKLAKKPVAKPLRTMELFIRHHEIPAAYFSGRLKHATEAMEAYLDLALAAKHVDAYDLLGTIFNGEERPQPTNHVAVTLFHLYQDAGRSLGDWPNWKTWVERLHPGLLKLSGIKRAELAADATLLGTFHERIRSVGQERRTAAVSFGQKDLLEPKEKVLARQKKVQRWMAKPSERGVTLREKQALYFPWLQS